MELKWYELVLKAQQGDKEALTIIIQAFFPAIGQAKHKANRNEHDDIQQAIIEMMIHKILNYDISQSLNYSSFCKHLNCGIDPMNLWT
ncbi:DNA-directed RNA polymerase specialized sigma subunit [Paenibacillus endophyticus]|uniref:DNA-directed RNA polymerase specialized sigma subunit n=1 Tax=Paenibacillus endophyticus TaxID=1294268 RepID=A0A7W5C7F4_9BACL|nr:helix-turn-helix domain-containing protein [Paenibacillus endophyticus]MBB3152536.1 DNA-directed RNA polymerase specialized sigma subunit [Paenibacillus endophyticus]